MISLIFASGIDDSIGYNNKLLWRLRQDLISFKKTTLNKTIIMGYTTFQSLPQRLKNRKYIVLTRKNISEIPNIENMEDIDFTNNYEEIISKYKESDEEVIVIGGSQIYSLFLEHCDKVYHTEVKATFDYADTFFKIDKNLYTKEKEVFYKKDINNEYDFNIIVYKKNK